MTVPNPAHAIAAIVVSHESGSTIDDCLTRLRAATDVAQIRIVDNASQDGTLAIVQRHAAADARVRFVANPDNPGFSIACNQGAADSDAPWLAFVNPDCLVNAGALARLRAHADTIDREVLLGADLVDEHGASDPAARRHDPDFGAMLSGREARQLGVATDRSRTLQPVDAVSGALMLLPRRLFDRVDGFDEGYRLHAEDLDLCRRARGAGAAVLVANDIRVVHLRGVSSQARPLFVEWHKHRGLWRYFGKFEAPRRSMVTRCAVFAAIWVRFVPAALRAVLQ